MAEKKVKDLPDDKKIVPHHAGHRDRLRGRFVKSGAGAFEDYELLELLLFTAIPRRDVKPLAKQLLKQFGGLPGLMGASLEDLQSVQGLGENAAVFLKTIQWESLT